jgi:hypothetical protein
MCKRNEKIILGLLQPAEDNIKIMGQYRPHHPAWVSLLHTCTAFYYRTTIYTGINLIILTEKVTVDLGSVFPLGKAECPLLVTSNRCTPVKNTLG